MALQRYGLVISGLLIIALGIVAMPVSAYDYTGPPDDLVGDIFNSTDLGNALSVAEAMAATHSSHASGAIPVQADPAPPQNAIVAAPDLTLSDSIGPQDSLQAAINAAPDGGTIWLDPGIYSEHDIIISKNIFIRSNASAGGNRYNTIIDAREQGRIFNVTGSSLLSLDSLTLRNATLDGGGGPVMEGGAIFAAAGSTLNITSVSFIDCTVTGSTYAGGGAVSSYGLLTVTSSSFEDCTATGIFYSNGGAIWGMPTTTITASSFTDCAATGPVSGVLGSGGAIYNVGTVTSSTFENCTATGTYAIGGAIAYVDTVASSSFRNCSATGSAAGGNSIGGAIYNVGTVASSTFENCSATASIAIGGAIASFDTVITESSFTNCAAADPASGGFAAGGAIFTTSSSTLTITSTRFTGCTATGPYALGGAILSGTGSVTVTSSTFTGCSANGGISGSYGGAIGADGTGTITSSTFTGCSAGGIGDTGGGAIYFGAGEITVNSSTFTGCSVSGGGGGYGGAILSGTGSVTVTSSTFTGCSASGVGFSGHGGAIMLMDASGSITNSIISGCTAGGNGGAIWSANFPVSITGSSITGCSANQQGGAIYNNHGTVTVTSSTITTCSADQGGAILSNGGTVTINGSTISSCTAADSGGAVWSDGTGITITSSTISGCTATDSGGAITTTGGTILITGSDFTDCSAGLDGGAIYTTGTVTATGTTFTGCSADMGGAIFNACGTVTSTGSTFTGCSAGSVGGAIYNTWGGTATVHFSRIYQNTAPGASGFYCSGSSAFSAENNWWGTNEGPAAYISGPVSADPWLVLGITADPLSITVPQTSYIRTNLTYNSDGTNTAGGGIFIPDAIVNAYTIVSGPGSVAPATRGTANGAAQTTYITLQPGTTTIAGTVDGQTVYITLNVAQGTWTPAPTEVPNDDDWPQAGTGASGGGGSGGGGSAATTGSSGFPLMTVTVNIGGDSKAWQAIVTGTKLSDLIVTGNVQSGAGGNFTSPPGIVFQYMSLVPARYNTITNAVVNFTVPQSWIEENHIDPGSIVLYRLTPNGWEALPTTVLYTKDGTVYFSAVSPGFSLFAITGTPTVLTPPGIAATQEIVSTPAVQEQAPAPAAVAKAPVTTQTTAPPVPSSVPAGSSSFPVVPALIGIGCIGLVGGGWYVRRWWIRRQNPALFREYD